MDRARTAFEAQRAKWVGLFNKIGDHPTLAYVLHEGAAQMNVDNLDLTNANDIQSDSDDSDGTDDEPLVKKAKATEEAQPQDEMEEEQVSEAVMKAANGEIDSDDDGTGW